MTEPEAFPTSTPYCHVILGGDSTFWFYFDVYVLKIMHTVQSCDEDQREKNVLKSLTVPGACYPPKSVITIDIVLQRTKMIKIICPDVFHSSRVEGVVWMSPSPFRTILWKPNSSVFSCSSGQRQDKWCKQILAHCHEEWPSSQNCPTVALTAS